MFDLQLLVQVALGQPFEPSLEDRSFDADGKPVANSTLFDHQAGVTAVDILQFEFSLQPQTDIDKFFVDDLIDLIDNLLLHIFHAKRSFVFVERQQHGQAVGILLWTRIRFYDVKQA
jgi:hypothetical protein